MGKDQDRPVPPGGQEGYGGYVSRNKSLISDSFLNDW